MLEFKVTDQTLVRIDKFGVVADSINYLKAKFDFTDSEFGGVITVVFTPLIGGNSYELILTDNLCVVPWEVIKTRGFKVSLYCDVNNERVTTDCVTIPVKESGYVKGETPKEPSPDVYEQLIGIANNAKEIAESVKQRADNGEFKGDKGDTGEGAEVDTELSSDSNNAIANSTVSKVLNNGKLLGFEIVSNYEDYCKTEKEMGKYLNGIINGGYVLILSTNIIYEDDDISDESKILLAQGIYVAKDNGEALLGVGIDTIQELIDELDTRYLPYDEWVTMRELIGAAIGIVSDSQNETQKTVKEIEKQLFDGTNSFKGFRNSIEFLTEARNDLTADAYYLTFISDKNSFSNNGFLKSTTARFFPHSNDGRTVEFRLEARAIKIDNNNSVINSDENNAVDFKLHIKNGSTGLPWNGDYRLVLSAPVASEGYEIISCDLENDILLIDSSSASKNYQLCLKLPYEKNNFDVSLDAELQHNNNGTWETIEKQTITVPSGDTYRFNTDDLTGIWFVPNFDRELVKLSADTVDGKTEYSVINDNSTVTLTNNTEYTGANISKLAIEYPKGDFECYISLTFAQEGDITVTLPESKYIGTPPVFANGERWELSIKNGVVVGGKAE